VPDFFGNMFKGKNDGKQFWYMTEHQCLPDTYIIVNGKAINIESDKWSILGRGKFALAYIHVSDLPSVPGAEAIAVGNISETGGPVGYFGFDINTYVKIVNTTKCYPDRSIQGAIVHSATTGNNSCGGVLFDFETQTVIGIHCSTGGPNRKGDNNFAAALKY